MPMRRSFQAHYFPDPQLPTLPVEQSVDNPCKPSQSAWYDTHWAELDVFYTDTPPGGGRSCAILTA
jgi:hypothetical protein